MRSALNRWFEFKLGVNRCVWLQHREATIQNPSGEGDFFRGRVTARAVCLIRYLTLGLILCLPASLVKADSITATVTVDNGYGFGFGDINGIYPAEYYGGVDNCSASAIFNNCYVFVPPDNPNTDDGPEIYYITNARSTNYIYIVAWSDDSTYQGAVATFTDNTTGVTVTTSPAMPWQVFATGTNWAPNCSDTGAHGPPLAGFSYAINNQIAIANASSGGPGSSVTWVGNVASANGRLDFSGQFGEIYPDSVPSCIGTNAVWMEYNPEPTDASCNPFVWGSTPDYTSIPNFLREYLIYRIGPVGQIFITTNTCTNGCITIYNPNDIVVTTCSNSLPVNFTAGVSDACCSNCVAVVSDPPSGYDFPLGTTTVTSTATDALGNSNICTFTVTVIQNANPPVVTASLTNVVICVPTPTGCGPMPDITSEVEATAAIPGGTVTITQSIPPGTPICTNTNVIIIVSDACGDATNYTLPCILTNCCLSIDCSNIVEGTCSNSMPVFFSVTAWDYCCSNCPLTVISTPASGYNFPVGTTTVTNTAADSVGASNYCTFTVTVVPVAGAPVFGCVTPPVNLVPNGGFETYSSCPNGPSEINLATPWFQPTGGTPDYFNSCAPSSSGVSTPANFVGSVAPHSGNGYAGGTAYTVNGGSYGSREYIEVPLASPLVASQSYQVSFYVSLSESMYGIDSMGAYFSAGPLEDSSTWNALAVTPQVRNPPGNFLTSIGSWTLVSGTFTAAGGENYLTIGNFSDDADTLSTRSSAPEIGSTYGSYYYIDDVSVSNMCGCAPDKVVVDTSEWTFDAPTAYDPSTGTPVNVAILSTVTNGPCPLAITRTWVATNSCGGSNLCSQTVTVLESPQILCTNIVVSSCVNTPVFYSPSAIDPCCPNDIVYCDPPSGSSFAPGTTTTVICTTSNCFSLVGANQFTVTVQSAIVNQTNIILSSCTNLPIYFNPTVISSCCSNWQIMCFPPSGEIFDVGTTNTVLCVASDPCDDTNVSTFTVTVLPGTNCTDCLQIQCPTNVSVMTCSNCAIVNFKAMATNPCCSGQIAFTYSSAPGSCFPLGTTPVQVTATDSCNNTAVCMFNVTVTQNSCPPIISVGPTNFILCAGASGCVPMPDEVHATPNFFVLDNTGVSGGLSASGTEALPQATLNDPHWTLVSVPVVPAASPLEFGTNTQLQINSLPQWLNPDTLSAWIAPANDGSNDAPEGDYDYQTTFVLPTDGTFTISAQVAADDYVSDVLANGLSTGVATTNGNSATQWNPITIIATGVAGTNTLDFIVHNNPTIGNNPPSDNMDSPSGLLVEFNGITIQPAQGQTQPYLPYNPAAVQATNCDGSTAPGWQSIPAGTILCGNTNITFVFTNPCGDTTSYTATVTVENCCTPPPSYMVLWLTFDETVGNICLNSAGGNAGVRYAGAVTARNTNGPSHNVGEYVNNSLCFNGLDDMVLVPDYPAIDFATNNFSIDAWVKWNGTGDAVQVLADHRTQSGGNYYGYEWFLDNGKPGLQLGTGPYANFVSPNAIPANVWTHLAVTVQRGSASGVKFYVNGALSDFFDDTHVTGSIALRPIQYVAVGNLEPSLGGSSPFNGCMDELELFARVLLPYEVADIYGAFHAGKCRPTCSVPAVSTLCLGVNTVMVPVEVCNTGSTTQFLTVNFAGLSWIQAGGPPATNGPSIYSSPTYVVLPPNTCTNFDVTITKPPGLNLANVAYYEMMITDPLGQRFSSIGKIQEIDTIWCNEIHIQNITNVLIPTGPVNIGFMVNNPTGVSYPLSSQVVAVDGNLNPETNVVSLNGLAPGTPVTNQFILPANGSTPVSVNVSYVGPEPSTPYYLVLYLNIRYDGVSIPVASAGFAQVIPPTVGPPMSVCVTNGQAVITWDAVNTGWTLISTTNLGSTNWIPVNLPVLPQPDGSEGVTVPMTNNAQFFQLLNPGSP